MYIDRSLAMRQNPKFWKRSWEEGNCFLVQYHTFCFHLGIYLIVVPSPYHLNTANEVSVKILIGPTHWRIMLLHEVQMLS